MASFLPTPAPKGLVPVPEFPFPPTAVRGLPIPLHPVDFGKWSLTPPPPATVDTLWTILMQVLCAIIHNMGDPRLVPGGARAGDQTDTSYGDSLGIESI